LELKPGPGVSPRLPTKTILGQGRVSSSRAARCRCDKRVNRQAHDIDAGRAKSPLNELSRLSGEQTA